ncbi:MAG: 6-bladed beta-propeller [Marinilabiliaceae bacterium]|nr:6-bladed beta-propeller [Marinilabiliaceae bacterium]
MIQDSVLESKAKKMFEGQYREGKVKLMKRGDDNYDVVTIPSLGKEMLVINIHEYFDSISVVKLETTDSSVVGRIDKLYITSEGIVILDRDKARSVKLFDHSGKYKHSFGCVGNGPGKFSEATDLFVAENQVVILDQFQNKIIVYDMNGDMMEEKRIPFIAVQVGVSSTGKYYFAGSNCQNYHIDDLVDYNLWSCDSSMQVDSKWFYSNHSEDKLSFLSFNNLTKGGEKLWYSSMHTDSIFSIDNDNLIKKEFVLNYEDNHDMNCFYSDFDKFKEEFNLGKLNIMMDYIASDDLLLLSISHKTCTNVLFNRRTKAILAFDMIAFDGDANHSLGYSGTLYNDRVVWFLYPENYLTYNSVKDWNLTPESQELLNQLSENITHEDNPVLVFMRPKR